MRPDRLRNFAYPIAFVVAAVYIAPRFKFVVALRANDVAEGIICVNGYKNLIAVTRTCPVCTGIVTPLPNAVLPTTVAEPVL